MRLTAGKANVTNWAGSNAQFDQFATFQEEQHGGTEQMMNVTLGAKHPGLLGVTTSASLVPQRFQTIAAGPPYKKSQSLNRQADARNKNANHAIKRKFSPKNKNFAPRLGKNN